MGSEWVVTWERLWIIILGYTKLGILFQKPETRGLNFDVN